MAGALDRLRRRPTSGCSPTRTSAPGAHRPRDTADSRRSPAAPTWRSRCSAQAGGPADGDREACVGAGNPDCCLVLPAGSRSRANEAATAGCLAAVRPLAAGFGVETAMTIDAVGAGFRVEEVPASGLHAPRHRLGASRDSAPSRPSGSSISAARGDGAGGASAVRSGRLVVENHRGGVGASDARFFLDLARWSARRPGSSTAPDRRSPGWADGRGPVRDGGGLSRGDAARVSPPRRAGRRLVLDRSARRSGSRSRALAAAPVTGVSIREGYLLIRGGGRRVRSPFQPGSRSGMVPASRAWCWWRLCANVWERTRRAARPELEVRPSSRVPGVRRSLDLGALPTLPGVVPSVAVVAFGFDLRERAMLGDAGATCSVSPSGSGLSSSCSGAGVVGPRSSPSPSTRSPRPSRSRG